LSKPKGKRIQRELAKAAKDFLEPFGFECELDFSKRGGHQQLLVSHNLFSRTWSIEIVSTPRDEGHALTNLRQRLQRLVRDVGLA
jgi:hypothetical protein